LNKSPKLVAARLRAGATAPSGGRTCKNDHSTATRNPGNKESLKALRMSLGNGRQNLASPHFSSESCAVFFCTMVRSKQQEKNWRSGRGSGGGRSLSKTARCKTFNPDAILADHIGRGRGKENEDVRRPCFGYIAIKRASSIEAC